MQTEQDWQTRAQTAWSATSAKLSSMLARYRSGSGTSSPWSTLLVGAAIGLLLGLFIGWVVWPVEWQGARITHLDADAKAQYVATVADAYVAAGGTDTARELARRRLAGLDLSEAIVNAQRYFIANNRAVTGVEISEAERVLVENDSYNQRLAGDANIRLSNLNQLAAGLGAESILAVDLPADQTTTGAVGAPGGDIQPIETATVPAQVEGTTAADSDTGSGISFFSIVLAGLAAVVLIAGGLWVLYRLSQQSDAQEGEPSAERSRRPQAADDLQQVPLGASYAADDVEQYRNPATQHERSRSGEIGGFSFTSQETVEPFAPENVGEGVQEWSSSASGAEAEQPPADRPTVYSDPAQFADWDYDTGTEEDSASDAALSEFTAQYEANKQPSYEESRNIVIRTPDGNEVSIGEYGLGVNIQNGVRDDAPQDVIALDLWLFDKSDTRSPKNHTLVFLSPYAVEHNLADSIHGDRADDPEPVVPQAGDRYQLHGVDLTLDCQVLDVEYIPDGDGAGAFANLEVHLSVFQPAG